MLCSNCGGGNPPDASFCEQCGRRLELLCPACTASVSTGAKFCKKCGASIDAASCAEPIAARSSKPAGISRLPVQAADVADGERKLVTALFADIKGSTELLEDLDPEQARAIIDPALKMMIESVRRYDGYVVQSTGDGIFALFGAPAAHEDHPQWAVYGALRLQDAIRTYSAKLVTVGGTPLEARVGVHTGEVVVRSLATAEGRSEYTPIGHAANLASRVQAVAPTGSIAITENTRRFVEGYFLFKPLGRMQLKGISEPIYVYEVVGLGPMRTRLQRSIGQGLTRFVGRGHETAALQRALGQSKAGHGQVVTVVADPGLGKSRLFYEFKALCQSECLVLEAYSVSHDKASAYLPVIELLREYFQIGREDDDGKRRQRIVGKLLQLDRGLQDTLPYFYSLLGAMRAEDSLAQMDPSIRRRRTLEAIKRILLRESLNQPLIVMVEDLHWIDGETQALLDLLVDAIANSRILLLVNYRPEFRHDWGGRTYYTQLRLDPLGYDSAAEMLSALLGDEAELESLKKLITEKTEGNPLFVEEMVQAFFEEGLITRNGKLTLKRPPDEIKTPPTIQAILASRIDRLPPDEKALLQTLAVIGREFTLPLIRRLAGNSEVELERLLGDLQRGEFIYERPSFLEAEYIFKHALTQEVAYASVLLEHRKLLHEEIGDAIESLYAGRLEECCEALAHHYSLSANTWKAVRYLHLAGQQAMRFSAHAQAINRFRSGLELLRTLPVSPEQVEQELLLQIDLGVAVGQAKGYSALEAGQAFVRARELCLQLSENRRVVQVLWGLWYFYFARAEHQAARDVAEKCTSLASRLREEALLQQASYILGGSQLLTGDLNASQQSLEYAIRSYDDRQLDTGIALQSSQHPKVSALCAMALVYWHLGYPDRALQAVQRAHGLARAVLHHYSQAFALGFTGWIHIYRGEARLAEESAEATISLATEHGFPLWLGWGRITKGRAVAKLGKLEQGIDLIRQGMGVLQSSESELQFTFWLALLAQTQQELRLAQQGLASLADALTRVGKTGERYYEPELYRLKGELLLQSGDAHISEAQTCFHRAIEIAREQKAKSWELRATSSIARMLAKHGHRAEARTMLAEIYNWFTEGFDTADLKDAKSLLDALAT
jgi:class 3 adenylate cyclase/predicted ATPase